MVPIVDKREEECYTNTTTSCAINIDKVIVIVRYHKNMPVLSYVYTTPIAVCIWQ